MILICSSYFYYGFSLPANLLRLPLLLNACQCIFFLVCRFVINFCFFSSSTFCYLGISMNSANCTFSSIVGQVVALVTGEEYVAVAEAFLLCVLTITKIHKRWILLSQRINNFHIRCHCYCVEHDIQFGLSNIREVERNGKEMRERESFQNTCAIELYYVFKSPSICLHNTYLQCLSL